MEKKARPPEQEKKERSSPHTHTKESVLGWKRIDERNENRSPPRRTRALHSGAGKKSGGRERTREG
jgi:hypothetical protein